ncbi:MAG: hypothetical protein GX047_09220 [Firmicutes bacterium]|jgi:predicted nucleotide-binding protein (sugar kinase/HSP70/actin superfamily)|nr:hypothetical protein [Bacillota bacterium]
MGTTVGIPRALAYHDYSPLWKAFLSNLGAEPVISPPTNQAIVNDGVGLAVDGTCLPVKIFYGHVSWLIEAGVDSIFLPRLISVAPKEYICPKFMGLPDMMAAAFPNRARFIAPVVNLTLSPRLFYRELEKVGQGLGCTAKETRKAWDEALAAQKRFQSFLQGGNWPAEYEAEQDRDTESMVTRPLDNPNLRIGLLGHSYVIYDKLASMDAVSRLHHMGAEVLTVDMLSPARIEAQAVRWPKRMFWTSGRRILGAAWEYTEMPVDGIIYITAFGCGTDSLTAELVERTVRRRSQIPQLILNIDEHTGEAGVVTRLEAFVDMLRWRRAR